ncbi:major allergen Asp f 2-like protein [Eremomyces bilateralis CBS 781.70]|uniref:Major allergen Asp f 2-like protein n=1 Tax=Eremomyces bilateralis CBS 781.70 TaxID=1392243 RepID=A0A6G1FR65_9PEZI|nr:major allergen Asp f 2-like protein [Eremomyces bilateralis CBS 781.70]KAF1808267.1 major allergen Asp f 2-like protein [Eremomyces bilateralis CBS 781.70]
MPSIRLFSLLLTAIGSVIASPLSARAVVVTVAETSVTGLPSATPYQWSPGAVTDIPIHSSCNATERTQLRRALNEAVKLASHAREHILRSGNQSPYYIKYFGNASTAEPIGWYSRVVSADRGNMTFRCDDPDQNCATQAGWAGHWRGANATQETVICPLSYLNRLPLETMCGRGYTVATSPPNTYFAVDLLHRLFHVPQISEDTVTQRDPYKSTRDSDALQLFAIDVYAYDIAVPGTGCSGDDVAKSIASSMSAALNSAAPYPATSDVPAACHTHADGLVHCESD